MGGWQKSVNGIHLACDNGHISVTHAKYYAPRNILCTPMRNALSVTQTRCNDLEDCYISTQPNQFYGNPCFLWQKKVEVSYNCIYCEGGEYFTGSGCAKCPQGDYSDGRAKS